MSDDIREHALAIYDTARCLTLIRLANLGHALAAWAESRDLDHDWADFTRPSNTH